MHRINAKFFCIEAIFEGSALSCRTCENALGAKVMATRLRAGTPGLRAVRAMYRRKFRS